MPQLPARDWRLASALLAGAGIAAWLAQAVRRRRAQDPLMELAAGIRGTPPPDLMVRSERVAAKKALARPPRTQDEELANLDVAPSPRFDVDDPAWLAHLEAEGYTVVADVLDAGGRARAEDLLWDFLEQHTTWRRSAPQTWHDERSFEKIGSVQNGLVNGGGMGQSDFLWHLRTLPAVRRAFSLIWDTDALLASFDGGNVFRPWHCGFRKTVGGWWHVDQGRAKQGRHCVQGFVSLFAAGAETGGLTVVPRSHLRFPEVVEDMQDPKVDYCTVQPYCPVLQQLPTRLVSCGAGDLVLWDSRTIHANAPAPQEPELPGDRLLRAVGYVCMTPKRLAPKEVLAARRSAYEHWFSTSHWPHQFDLGSGWEDRPPRSLADASPDVAALVA